MTNIPRWQKYVAGATLAGGLYLGGEAMQDHEATRDYSSDVQTLGGLAALITVGAMAQREVIDRMAQWSVNNSAERNQSDLERYKEGLPLLKDDVTIGSMQEGLLKLKYGEDEYLKDNVKLPMMSRWIGHYYRYSTPNPLNPKPSQLDAYGAVDRIVNNLVDARQSSIALRHNAPEFADSGTVSVIDACLILDMAAPIDDNCPLTPQTSHEGKYWIDFVEQQARLRQPVAY